MIVVFGSLNVDLVLPVSGLPGPGETVLTPAYRVVPGGKGGNQALAAARAGARVAMYGCVGRDGFAEVAVAGLGEAGVRMDGVGRVAAATGCAAVCVETGGENQIVVASGANLATRADQVPDDALGRDTILVLQLEVPLAETTKLIARARALDTRIVLNAAPAAPLPAEALEAVDVLVVNAGEASMLSASYGLDGSSSTEHITALAGAFGGAVVATLGARGAVVHANGRTWQIGALEIAAVDTTGAGDAFTGVLAAALDKDATLCDAVRRASVAGALACRGEGAQANAPTAGEIDARLAELAPAIPI